MGLTVHIILYGGHFIIKDRSLIAQTFAILLMALRV
uniref:Uncharacterized protein n=1 Tax=Anguilla anguilla TaxID=7936 RepID=A0A0E9RZ73_ANGAN